MDTIKAHFASFFAIQRAFLALCLITLIGCSTPACRQWEMDDILTKIPCFNGGRVILSPDSDYSYLELEITRSSSGIRFYLNLLALEAPPWKEDPARTCITIAFEGQEPWTAYPYLLAGGQRLLLPGNIADVLIQALLDEHPFMIQIGRYQISVIPDNFSKVYKRLLDLPIEEFLEPVSEESVSELK